MNNKEQKDRQPNSLKGNQVQESSVLGGKSYGQGDAEREAEASGKNVSARKEHQVDEENNNSQKERERRPGAGDRLDMNRDKNLH